MANNRAFGGQVCWYNNTPFDITTHHLHSAAQLPGDMPEEHKQYGLSPSEEYIATFGGLPNYGTKDGVIDIYQSPLPIGVPVEREPRRGLSPDEEFIAAFMGFPADSFVER